MEQNLGLDGEHGFAEKSLRNPNLCEGVQDSALSQQDQQNLQHKSYLLHVPSLERAHPILTRRRSA